MTARHRCRPEDAIQRAVFQHLRARGAPKVFAFHPANGGYRKPVEAAILKSLGVVAGVPDVIAIHNGRCYALELKAEGDRAYAEFMRNRPTPEATVDALVYSLRRGIAELTKPDTLRRLSELDKGQLKAICRRLQNFNPEIATPWSSNDVAALIVEWRELHG